MAATRPFRPLLLAALALVAGLALASCGKRDGAEQAPEHGDQAVAKVDGKTIWTSDVKREAIAEGKIGEGEPLDVASDEFRQALDEVIDQRLLAAEAVKRKLERSPGAVRRLEAARNRVLGDLLVDSVVTDAVNDNAVRGLYQEQLKLAKRSEEIHARQIVTATAADAEALKKLLASGASFEALAMERSTDPATRFNGGDLGYFTTDVMPDAYDAALKDAKSGQLVGPFAVEGGFALVKIEDRRMEQPLTLDAARPQIVRFLTYDQIRDLLEKLRSRAKVTVLLKGVATNRATPPADAPKTAAAPAAPSPPPPAKAAKP